jgi:hypothetical protein
MDVRLAKPPLQREFENYMHQYGPEFFDKRLPRPLRMAAFRRALATPDAVLSTPQDRLINTVPWLSGTTVRVFSPDIPRSLYPYWILRLNGNLTKTEGGAGTLVGEGPLTFVRGFRILQDGEILKDIDLTHLRVISHHIYRGIDTAISNITLGNQTAQAFSARVALDFRTLRSEDPTHTYWPADRYGQIAVEVDWGSQTSTTIPELINGGTYSAVSFSTSPTLQIWAKEVLNPARRGATYWLQRYSQKVAAVSSLTQTLQPYQLPVGEVIRGILISQYTNSPRAMISTLLTSTANIKLRANGTYYKFETQWQELVDKNTADYGVALPTGYAFIDFMDPDNGGLYESAFRADKDISILEAMVDTASVSGANLQFTLITFKPARNYQ